MRISSIALVTALAATQGAVGLWAQVTGLPVRNSGVAAGFTLGVEGGAVNQDYGDGKALGVRAGYGTGRFGVTATLSRYDVADPFPNQTGYGVAANLRLTRARRLPLTATLQAGAEMFALDGNRKWHFPIGVGFAVDLRSGPLTFRPWAAPRLDLFRNEFDDPDRTSEHFGLSGGLDLNFGGNWSLTLAADRTFADDAKPTAVSVGVLLGL